MNSPLSKLLNYRTNSNNEIEAIFPHNNTRAIALLKKFDFTSENYTTYSKDKVRVTSKNGVETYQTKNLLTRVSLPDYKIYVNVKEEIPIAPVTLTHPVHTRVIERHNTNLTNSILSVSKVTENNKDHYEVEVEWKTNDVDGFYTDILLVYGKYFETDLVYTFPQLEAANSYLTTTFREEFNRAQLNKPISLTYAAFNNISQGYVSIKAEGMRKLLLAYDGKLWLIYPPFAYNYFADYQGVNFLCDCEVLDDKILLFDCLIYDDRDIRENNYYDRHQHCYRVNLSFTAVKEIYPLKVATFFDVVARVLDNKLDYPQDGLIFTSKLAYNNKIYKWKDPKDLTIDLLYANHNLYTYDTKAKSNILFKGDNVHPLSDLTIDYPPKEGIYEFEVRGNVLQVRKEREDKTSPNELKVVLDLWKQIYTPIDKDDLLAYNLKLAFRYHNRFKHMLYNMSKVNNATLLDIGSGRGGDLNKWSVFHTVYAVEPNAENAAHLRKRYEQSKVNYYHQTTNNLLLHILPYGGEQYNEIFRHLTAPVDVVSLMLSLSFFDPADYESLLRTIDGALAPGGKLIIFTIDGNTVTQIPYQKIDLHYTRLTKQGEKVLIELPESEIVGTQEEYLVDVDKFVKQLTAENNYSVDYYAPADGFNEVSKGSYPLLSDIQLAYSRMYSGLIFTKHKHLTFKTMSVQSLFTIGDGNCFFHSLLGAISNSYRQSDGETKRHMATMLRKNFADIVSTPDSKYPGYCYWETATSNLFYARLLLLQYTGIVDENFNLSIEGTAQYLRNSNGYIGQEVYAYVPRMLKYNLLIVSYVEGKVIKSYESNYEPSYDWIVVYYTPQHYSTLVPNNEDFYWTLSQIKQFGIKLDLIPPLDFQRRNAYLALFADFKDADVKNQLNQLPPWDAFLIHIKRFIYPDLTGNLRLEYDLLTSHGIVLDDRLLDMYKAGYNVWNFVSKHPQQYREIFSILRNYYVCY